MTLRRLPVLLGLVLALAACGLGQARRITASQRVPPPVASTMPHRVEATAAPAGPAVQPTPTPAPTPAPTPSVQTDTIEVGGTARQYVEYTPGQPLTASTPIMVFLSGVSATIQGEVGRDVLLPYVAAGSMQLVYPVGIGESWNAGGCCGPAATADVDDVSFIEQLAHRLDPGRARPIYLVGYSNGGRLAYTLACDDPGLVDAFAIVNAVPLHTCTTPRPITILQVDGTADNEVPYLSGDQSIYPITVTATQQVADLRALDGCTSPAVTDTRGSVSLSTWSCAGRTRVGFVTYQGGNHHWSAGDLTTPGTGPVIWSFLSRSSLPG